MRRIAAASLTRVAAIAGGTAAHDGAAATGPVGWIPVMYPP